VKFDQIYAEAESRNRSLGDNNCIEIYISASENTTAVTDISDVFLTETGKHHLAAEVILTGSTGYYDLEPIVLIEKPGHPSILFKNVNPEAAVTLSSEYLVNGRYVENITLGSVGGEEIDGIPCIDELPLFYLQNRVALRNCGQIDPGNIDHYILKGKGYSGLTRALSMSPAEVIAELGKSGLRGKGGAGYLTADKWQACYDAEGDEKFVVCNAVDSDPDSLAARLILESDPHSALEGTLIAAYAVGAYRCIICVNERNTQTKIQLEKALEQMKEYSLMGQNILDSGFSCVIEVREEIDSFISGEETALIRSIEGKQPLPYLRTVYPAVSGINGNPTLVNNLETFSCVSGIFQNGAEWYTSSGTGENRGTKVITLTGSINHKYTVEVPFGTTLESVVMDIGGGTPDGKSIKAVQFGGPTGSYFDTSSLNTTIDYEPMKKAGSIIGSGVVKVFDDSMCAVEMVRDLVDYIQTQSCGKCVFCREGSYQIYNILKDISENMGKPEDLDLVTELCEAMKEGCICSLGLDAPNPVLSSIRLFGDDYEAHIKNKKCPAN
jgi:NADH-quinone oxidoreductase subunit F